MARGDDDPELAKIERLFRELQTVPAHTATLRALPAYRDRVAQIRVLVDHWKVERGAEMIEVIGVCR